MMEDETRQLLIGLFEELKTEINAVGAGQEELRNDIENSISDVKDNISALETKINAGQEELRQEIKTF
jgi:predicted  nucleic acid-binding Zn-ribbon protein